MRHVLAIAILGAAFLDTPVEAARKFLDLNTYLDFERVSDPQISPNGQLIAFTVTEASLDSNRNVSRIWIVPAGGGAARQLTEGPGSDRRPRWAPDSRSVAFISTRSRGAQVWRVPVTGGDPERITTLAGGVNDFSWSPDGRYLFLVSDVKWPAVQEVDRR